MSSPDLLRLVESCPAGGEILIMRMLYILTENGQFLCSHREWTISVSSLRVVSFCVLTENGQFLCSHREWSVSVSSLRF